MFGMVVGKHGWIKVSGWTSEAKAVSVENKTGIEKKRASGFISSSMGKSRNRRATEVEFFPDSVFLENVTKEMFAKAAGVNHYVE